MNARATARRRAPMALATAAVGALVLAGCSSGSDGGDEKGSSFEYLSLAENTAIKDTFTALGKGSCADEEAQAPLKVTTQPQASYDQQAQLLAGQGALPTIFSGGNSPQVVQQMNDAGQLVKIGDELEDLDKSDAILPGAQSTIEAIYDGEQVVLPTEFNIEGIWYNKKLFTDNGIKIPATWDDLNAAADKLESAGVTPFAAAGKDGWPVTRLVGNYLYRTLGPDAMQKVADGEAKLTDADYVAAAQAVADLGKQGYFGESVGSIDYTTALNQFLTGKAGMYYMGSWALANFNDPKQNQIGEANIGFMPFPEVSGGAGSSSQLAANVGTPLAMSEQRLDDGAQAWLGCIADNYGAESLKDQGVLSGFKVNGDVGDLPPLTRLVQEQAESSDETVLWFEALFDPKATTTSQTNAQRLVTGDMSPEEFMASVQGDLG
ncbi:ABC transporter substrate-binding protein [Nocardioides sp. NPDC101246]|uniref:ABC transporter substrate-binding protein n=1 Tax=Nocardioides sp. NPDC101246 TaxID=3364336 RepID=UPI00381AE29F